MPMVEFNSDGSLKPLPFMVKEQQETQEKMKSGRCIMIKKEVVNFSAPKKCLLHIRVSDAISDTRFIETIHKAFQENSSVPSKIIKINEKEFDIEVETDFRRCSDCTKLIGRYREYLYNNLIEKKGNCTYEGLGNGNFCYEDYFE